MPTDTLRRLPLFQSLSEEDLRRLATISTVMPIESGETIYRTGDPPDGFYVVREGIVMLFGGPRDEAHEPLGRLRSGDSFGESGLFDGDKRSETARVEEAGALVKLHTPALLVFLKNQPLMTIKLQLAAARGHAANVKASFSLAKRRAVRYYVNKDIRLSDEETVPRQATLVDLSRLGVRIQGVPSSWTQDSTARFKMSWDDASLRRSGRVAWRAADIAGIEFKSGSSDEQAEIRRALDRLLAPRSTPSGGEPSCRH